MKLTIFNGSQKIGKTNTGIMIDKFCEGFMENGNNSFEAFRLNEFNDLNQAVEYFKKADYVLIAFPLYNYAMPAGVKKFIEYLEPLRKVDNKKKLLFLVQSGYYEAVHARPLEKYLVSLTTLLKAGYIGTIIKGGCDGLLRDANYFQKKTIKKILEGIKNIGKVFGASGTIDKNILLEYSKPENHTFISKITMKFIIKIINKVYWKKLLKKNNLVYEASLAKPYLN